MFQIRTPKIIELLYNRNGDVMKWYEKLKESRKKANYSQLQVSLILNISRSNISKYETGMLEPNIEVLKELCELYKVSSDYIIGITKADH